MVNLTDDKKILNSILQSETKYFTSMDATLDELSRRQSRTAINEIDGKKCRITADGVLDTEAGSFRLRSHGFSQMLGMLGIPRSYANRIPNDLLQHDINRLFQEKGVKTKLITEDQSVKGFLHASKVCVPNVRLLQHLTSKISDTDLEFQQAEVADASMRVKVTSPAMKFEVPRVGDVYRVGIDVTNSDVGATALLASAYTLCLRCTNGMVAPRDIWGVRKSRFGKGLTPENMLASFMLDVGHIATKLDKMQQCLLKATEVKATEDQLAYYAKVVGMVILDGEKAKVMCGQFSTSSTVYEVQYAITELSQKISDVLLRRRIEQVAGEMIFSDDRMLVALSQN